MGGKLCWIAGKAPISGEKPAAIENDLSFIIRFYAVGHYVFNPGGVPTAMITAWYVAREILKQRKSRSTEHIAPFSVLAE